MLRRDLLKSTVASVAGALALAPAGGAEASSELEAIAAELTRSFTPVTDWLFRFRAPQLSLI